MKFFGKIRKLYWCFTAFVAFLWIAIVASAIGLVFGCQAIPQDDTEKILAKIEKELGRHSSTASDAGATKPTADTTADGGKSASAPASGTLVYKYGGFHGENAVEDPNTQIKDLHMSKAGMSYKWAKGSLKNWGVTPDTNAGALACAFYWDGKQWIGGKFDHISTSRTTRDFNNLKDYKGWRKGPFFAAKKRAFCIVSKDGKKRTNLLETTEP